ncbi:CMGC family protein kinase [Histomonas meleagridis]|uniref:CMGC family protein kinase n=1 Tax=Histomonas meleagridis TaxID=135588 RepID=UPI00355AC330|nr:CMGC family protein kinase [Histomonas meleagridis]KAH0796504.1 CMGC family protein kinase [Histomonas meleagridis]
MHRDIKPDNVLINHTQRELAIIDWGLAELYIPKRQYSPGVGTLRYKAPELLLGYLLYDYGVDIWAVGVTMGEMLIRYPFFQGRSHDEIIGEIADLLSGSSILVYADELGIEVCDAYLSAMPEYNFPKWGQMVSEMNPELRDNDALDLLKKLLTVDHMKRISAKEALQHQFFDKLTRE